MSIMDMNFSKTLFYLSLIKHSQDLKVSFYLKKNETGSDGKAPVMGRIRVGKAEAPFSTRAKINPALWDTRSGHVSNPLISFLRCISE